MLTVHQPPPPTGPATPPDLYVCPFVVVQDNSEQLPFTFQGIVISGKQWIVKRQRCELKTGDYSIAGLSHLYTVERKSPDDLVGSVCGGHNRLEREHERMQAMIEAGGHAALVCEGNYAAMDEALRADGRWKAAETLLGTMASWPCKFGVPWFFAGDRRRAEILTFRLLLKWWLENAQVAQTARGDTDEPDSGISS